MSEIKHRPPAKTLKELYNNLDPLEFLTKENAHFYVPVYEETIDEIRRDLIWSDNPMHSIYLSGQSGSGKTTALNFLPNEEIEAEFIIRSFNAYKLLDLGDVDVIDILLMLAFELIEGDKALEKLYLDELMKMKGRHDGSFSQQTENANTSSKEAGGGGKAGFGIKFWELLEIGVDFFANYKTSKEQREITRQEFTFKKPELRDLVNKIIDRFMERPDPQGKKKLLIIFNELDHIKEWEVIRSLFMGHDLTLLETLRCKKVLSLPVILKTQNFRGKIYYLGMKLEPNPHNPDSVSEQEIKENSKDLLEIINKRIDKEVDLINEDAKQMAIRQSGGIIRQMVHILRYAILKAGAGRDTVKVSVKDVEEGEEAFRSVLQGSLITPDKILLLDRVRKTRYFLNTDSALLTEMVLVNQVILYENGEPWCDVNPLISPFVAMNAKRLEKEKDNDNRNA